MFKRLLFAAVLVFAAAQLYAIEDINCNAVQGTAIRGQAGACKETLLGGNFKYAYVTVQCPTSSTSEVVIWVKFCASCSAVRYPRVEDPPITNIGSIANKPSRTFWALPGTYSVQPEIQTWGAGAITVITSFE